MAVKAQTNKVQNGLIILLPSCFVSRGPATLSGLGGHGTFTCDRWRLLQVCPGALTPPYQMSSASSSWLYYAPITIKHRLFLFRA